MSRVYLSPPDVGDDERAMLSRGHRLRAGSHPSGPHVDAFEHELARPSGCRTPSPCRVARPHSIWRSMLVGVQSGDDVLVPTFTFVASANVAMYIGARPVLVDCDPDTWQIDPELVARGAAASGQARTSCPPPSWRWISTVRPPTTTDSSPLCEEYEVPLIEDAAEALGATYRGAPAGSFGAAGVFSFNGNKIITTSGGGMLVSGSTELVERARHLATQAREPVAPLRAHRPRLQLPHEQPAGGDRRGPTGRASTDAWPDARPSTKAYRAAVGRHWPGSRFMPAAPTTASPTTG